jgi:hypothetical protein
MSYRIGYILSGYNGEYIQSNEECGYFVQKLFHLSINMLSKVLDVGSYKGISHVSDHFLVSCHVLAQAIDDENQEDKKQF